MLFKKKEKQPSKPGWPDRMKLYSVLTVTKSLLENASPEESFYGHTADDSIKVINQAINYFHSPESTEYPEDIVVQFLPAGPLQELSMSNGWDKVYLLLSTDFDNTIYCLNEKI